MDLKEEMEAVASVNYANGWFEENRTFGEEIALLHSEVSEALEEYRVRGLAAMVEFSGEPFAGKLLVPEGDEQDLAWTALGHVGKPIGVPSEYADIFIRLLDACYRHGVDLEAEYRKKLNYNRTRGYRHGGKAL